MPIFNFMYPVRPGREDTARSFAKDLTDSRLDELTELQRRGDVRRETWTLQKTPTGTVMLVWFDGDVDWTFEALATGEDEFTRWYRAQVLDIAVIDLAVPNDGPDAEVIFEWPA